MNIITDLSHFEKERCPNLVVALGNFDGLHLGHLKILEQIKTRARALGGRSAVFTFREHPQRVLHQTENPPILTSMVHKLYLLEQSGIDFCFLMDFTVSFSKKSPEDFVSEVFVEHLGAREVCMGFNARFGHDRSGDGSLMRKLAKRFGFEFLEVPPVEMENQVLSSSAIRALVCSGRLEEAARWLGRRYSFFGTVVGGSGRGAGLGFQTANLDPHNEVLPPEGVYAVWVKILECQLVNHSDGTLTLESSVERDQLEALLNYGKRPTFGASQKPIPEVHVLDYEGSLKNRTVEVTVGKRLREERIFADERALGEQIERDMEQGRAWFAQQTS